MPEFCESCGQTVLGEGTVKVHFSDLIQNHAPELMKQLDRRRSVFEAIDKFLGYRVEDRLDEGMDYALALSSMVAATLKCLNELRHSAVAMTRGDAKECARYGNQMMETILQVAAEAVWMIADYGYPLAENVPEILRQLTREDREVRD